jgi:hypothetical protein
MRTLMILALMLSQGALASASSDNALVLFGKAVSHECFYRMHSATQCTASTGRTLRKKARHVFAIM